MRRRDHYLGWRNFTAVSRNGRVWHEPMDWQGLQRSREIAGQVRADVKRLQARQEEQYRNGIRCPDRQPAGTNKHHEQENLHP